MANPCSNERSGEAAGVELFDGRTRLMLYDPVRHGSVIDHLSVRVEGPDLSASRQVYAGWDDGFADLVRYFSQLADSWRGWKGERVFESLEHDLHLSATHDGHVHLKIEIWESTEPLGWRVQSELQVDAGEQLASAAREIADLVRS